jgi:hypothetical protein
MAPPRSEGRGPRVRPLRRKVLVVVFAVLGAAFALISV